jgi:hypothetical protein
VASGEKQEKNTHKLNFLHLALQFVVLLLVLQVISVGRGHAAHSASRKQSKSSLAFSGFQQQGLGNQMPLRCFKRKKEKEKVTKEKHYISKG